VGKVMGMLPPASTPDTLYGCAASPGVVRGVAKVLRTLDEAPKLSAGDILVAGMITPAWTPLFASVAAVITDGGGVLSHCAIVAREYGIPAVVSTGQATTLIREGQTIEVDGSAGVVRILA
jgi:pyruvate,water dikinase